MERFTILVGRLYKFVTPTNYFFKVQLVGCFMPLVGGIGRLVESPLQLDYSQLHGDKIYVFFFSLPFYCQISQYGTDNYQGISLKRKISVKIA